MKLIFIHIPKTGGSTFSSLLQNKFKIENRFHIHAGAVTTASAYYDSTSEIFRNLDRKIVNNVDLIHGHMPFQSAAQYSDFSFITFLRNPLKRVISDYLFSKSTPHLPLYHILNGMSLKDYVSQNKDLHLDNLQTRLISGKIKGDLNNSDVERAEEVIMNNFRTFGLTEYFDLSLIHFKDCLRWQEYPTYVLRNATKIGTSEITEVDIAAAKEYNKVDSILFENLVKLFLERVNSNKSYYENELNIFDKMKRAVRSKSPVKAFVKQIMKKW